MRRFLHLLLLPAFIIACQPAANLDQPEPAAVTGEVLFFDDFDTGSLDRSNWNVEDQDFWVSFEAQIYIDSTWTIAYHDNAEGAENGVMALTARHAPGWQAPGGRIADFVSGRVNSKGKFDFTYGRAEARLRMPDADGLWPAFWLLGNGNWPDTGEIDIMEYVGEPDWIGVALHGPGYSGETPLVNKYFFDEGESVEDWHTYAVDWKPDEITFHVDGRLIYRVTRPMVEHYGEWRFDNPKYLILNTAVGGAYSYKTNGVEEPYAGLPQSTVEQIRTSDVAMEVDWVRVTQDPLRHSAN